MTEEASEPGEQIRNAERMKFFTDAVVAIAMTLLILPLLESVSEARDLSTATFLSEHHSQLISFGISFLVIAGFWLQHERLYGFVGHWTGPLMTLNTLWMASIVFLPIATAMSGTMRTDPLQEVVYIGTMLLNSLLMGAMNLLVRGDSRIWESVRPGFGGIAASLALVILFAVALALALAVPGLSYNAVFLLFLTGPTQALLQRILERRATD